MINRIKNNAFAMNSLILFSGTILGSVLNYFFHLAIGRLVSIEVYGEIESLLSLMTIISVPAMTLLMVTTKYSAQCKADNDTRSCKILFWEINKKIIFYGLPLFFLSLALIPFIKDFLKLSDNLPLFFLWIIMYVSFFTSLNSGILSGWQKFKDVSALGILGALFKLILGIFLVKLGFGLNGAIGSFALATIVAYLASFFTLRFLFLPQKIDHSPQKNIEMFTSLKKYILPAFVGNLAITILGNADMILAKHALDATSAGQYGALTIVSKIIFFATGVIATVLFSMSAENDHKKSNSLKTLFQAISLLLLVSISSTILYFIFPNFILSLLFGNKYTNIASFLGWFAILVTIFSLVNVFFQYLLSIHQTRLVYWLLAISLSMIIFIKLFGNTISGILTISIIAQISAVILSGYFVISSKKKALT